MNLHTFVTIWYGKWSGGVRYIILSGADWSGVVSITLHSLVWTGLVVSVTL